MFRSLRLTSVLNLVALTLLPFPCQAQSDRQDAGDVSQEVAPDSLPAGYHEAMARGDTLAAIRTLEEMHRTDPEDALAMGELGILLAYTAPLEELDFTQRLRARELLEAALKKDPENPRYFLALGVVMEKALLRGDARLVVSRGLAAAEKHPDRVSNRELADAFYRRGHTLEEWTEEFVNLKNVPADQAQLGTLGCQIVGDAFCLNWTRPRRFFDHFQFFPDLSEVTEDDRRAMLQAYERAISLDSTHAGAWRGILRAHARTGRWGALLENARRWVRARSEDPWSRVFLATALVKSGESWDEAEPLFREALLELGERDRRVFLDLAPVLPKDQEAAWARRRPIERESFRNAWFRSRDPLYLSGANERRSAHYTRVALAELLFGEPQSGRRGWETDRGRILVRYGLPDTRWQVRRDDRRILRTQGVDKLTAGDMAGGRWIFWNYDPEQPSFVFEKKLGRPSVHHMASSQSLFMARDLKAAQPTAFLPPFRALDAMPFQMALFRSPGGNRHELEIHALVPAEELGGPEGSDSTLAGFFLDRRRGLTRDAEARATLAAAETELDIRIRDLGPGVYRYSLEAASGDWSVASVARGELLVSSTAEDGLRLSSLLLAREVVPTTNAPAVRGDLSVDPIRCLSLPRDRSFWVVFEAYGLEAVEGLARYRIDVSGVGERDPVVSFLRGLATPFLGEPEGPEVLSYQREVEVRRNRVLEWFRIRIPGEGEGELELRIRVTDLESGDSAEEVRTLAAEGC